MIFRSRGYSLISVLVVTAIGGVVAVMIMALIDNMTRVMVRANVTDSLEGTFRTVAAVLGNPDLCDNSLRGVGPGDKLVYNVQDNPVGPPPGGNELDITNIYAQRADNTPGATAIISAAAGSSLASLTGGVVISSIRFREKARNVGRGELRKGDVIYDTYAGEIEILVLAPGGSTIRRALPYTALVHRTNRTIDGCYFRDTSIQTLCNSMGGTYDVSNGSCKQMINASDVDCNFVCDINYTPPAPGPYMRGEGVCVQKCQSTWPANLQCIPVYHLLGFDYAAPNATRPAAAARPLCACTRVCYPMPAPPPAPPPVASPPPPPPPPPSN